MRNAYYLQDAVHSVQLIYVARLYGVLPCSAYPTSFPIFEITQKILVTRVFPGPSRSTYCPRYAFWVIFKMDGKTSEEKEENSCKTFDVKSRSSKMYHIQVRYAKAFYPCNVNSALLIPVHWHRRTGNFLPRGAVNHLPKKFL